jgi:hypothetical protein
MPTDKAQAMPTVAADIRTTLQQAGFEIVEVSSRPEKIGLRKDGCIRYIARRADGGWAPAGPAYLIIHGLECELEDRGYQKFWCSEGKRFPIQVSDLKKLQLFDQEVRQHLGWKSLYNESLGTTNARTVYDRLQGRPDR